jgi:hypothetical protein
MWQMIGVLAELERSLISEPTRAGVKAAQRRGVKFGRKRTLTPEQIVHAREMIEKGEPRLRGLPSERRALDPLPGFGRLTNWPDLPFRLAGDVGLWLPFNSVMSKRTP